MKQSLGEIGLAELSQGDPGGGGPSRGRNKGRKVANLNLWGGVDTSNFRLRSGGLLVCWKLRQDWTRHGVAKARRQRVTVGYCTIDGYHKVKIRHLSILNTWW